MASGAVRGQRRTDSLFDQKPGYRTEFPGLDDRIEIRKILAEKHAGNGTLQVDEQPINGLPDNGKIPVVANAVTVAVVTQEDEIGRRTVIV
jgi:hypothetical protein